MKKLFLLMAILATAATSCDKRPQPLAIDRHLTADEKQAGLFTPEVMWKMGRIASPSLSPDGTNALFTVTYYNVEENRGISVINLKSGNDEPIELTDYTSNNVDPRWSADGKLIYFLSDRSGSNQIWSMTPDGKNQKQISKLDKDVEGFGIAPAGDRIFYVLRVQVAERKSSDVHKDMPKSNARIYDDLMCRHWNYWDEGSYLHIFVGNLTSEGIANGKDIIGEKAEWDTPLAPYFDMGEIAWNNAGTRLAYTC